MKVWARSVGADGVGCASATSRVQATDVTPTCVTSLEDALRQVQALRWRCEVARNEVDRLRRELSTAEQAREQQDQRRAALVEAVADSVPSAMLSSRRQGWDEGWEAARMGLPKSANPHTG